MNTFGVLTGLANLCSWAATDLSSVEREHLALGLKVGYDNAPDGYTREQIAHVLLALAEYPLADACALAQEYSTDFKALKALASRPDLDGEGAAKVLRLVKGLKIRRAAAMVCTSVPLADALLATRDGDTAVALLSNVALPAAWRATGLCAAVNGDDYSYPQRSAVLRAISLLPAEDALDCLRQFTDWSAFLDGANAHPVLTRGEWAGPFGELLLTRTQEAVAMYAGRREIGWQLEELLGRMGSDAPREIRTRLFAALDGQLPGASTRQLCRFLRLESPDEVVTWAQTLGGQAPEDDARAALRQVVAACAGNAAAWQLLIASSGTMTGTTAEVCQVVRAAVSND